MNGTMGAGEQGQSTGPRVGSEISSMSFVGGYGAVQVTDSVQGGRLHDATDSGTRSATTAVDLDAAHSGRERIVPGAESSGVQGEARDAAPGNQLEADGHYPTSWTTQEQSQSTTTPPRRGLGRVSALSAWTSGLETAPTGFRWMSRLGDFLRTRTELLPSPFPGGSPERQSDLSSPGPVRPATPPRATGLPSFLGSNLFQHSVQPPSSSSGVPTEERSPAPT